MADLQRPKPLRIALPAEAALGFGAMIVERPGDFIIIQPFALPRVRVQLRSAFESWCGGVKTEPPP